MASFVHVQLSRSPEEGHPWECLVSPELAAQLRVADGLNNWLVAWGVSGRGDPVLAEENSAGPVAPGVPRALLVARARKSSAAQGLQVLVGSSVVPLQSFQSQSEYKVCKVSGDALPLVASAVLEVDADDSLPSGTLAHLYMKLNLHRAVLWQGPRHEDQDTGLVWSAVSVKFAGCCGHSDASEPMDDWQSSEWRGWLAARGFGMVTDSTRLKWSCARSSAKARPGIIGPPTLACRLCQVIDCPTASSTALVVGPYIDKALSLLAAAAEGKAMRLIVLSSASLLEVGQSFAAVRRWLLMQAEAQAGSVIVLVRPVKWFLQQRHASDDFAGLLHQVVERSVGLGANMRQAVQCNVCLFLVVDNITLSCKTADLRATFIQTQNARQLPAVRSPNKVLLRAYRRMLLHNSRRSVVRLLQTLLVRNADLACVQLSTSSQMAVLSNAGAHCGVKECSRLDFLPFTCSQCQGVFCLDHFRFEAHACPNAAGLDSRVLVCPLCCQSIRMEVGEDPNLTWERHVQTGCTNPSGSETKAKKARCPVAGCREILSASNSVVCGRCHQKVCLKHRFEEEHACSGAAASKPIQTRPSKPTPAPAAGWQCSRCTLVNLASATECAACGASPTRSVPSTARGAGWRCSRCTLDNASAAATCEACGASRPAALGRGQLAASDSTKADARTRRRADASSKWMQSTCEFRRGQGIVFLSLLAASPPSAWRKVFSDVMHLEQELAGVRDDSNQRSPTPGGIGTEADGDPQQFVSAFLSSLTVLRPGILVPAEVKDWLTDAVKACNSTAAGQPPSCVAVVGPPGCGKTSMLQCLKHLPFQVLPMSIPQLINSGIGDTQLAVRRLFESAQLQPSCVTLDDADDLFLQASFDSCNHGVSDLLVELVHMLDTCCSRRLLFILTCSTQRIPPSLACRLHFFSLNA
eukprot:s2124_g11.t1